MVAKTKQKTTLKGATVWVSHEDSGGGYEVSVHETEDGAYASVLEAIQNIFDAGGLSFVEEEDDLRKALKAKDGRAALGAFDEIISESGGDATGDVYLWITEQKVCR